MQRGKVGGIAASHSLLDTGGNAFLSRYLIERSQIFGLMTQKALNGSEIGID